MKILDQIEIDYGTADNHITAYIDIWDHNLSRKWLAALNELLRKNYHLEKNYCFFGWADGERNGPLIVDQINSSIAAINSANLGYTIDDYFTLDNSLLPGEMIPEHLLSVGQRQSPPGDINREHFNNLHRYFEDLQGVSGQMSPYYERADATTRWHIRQLNLLCHEFESWALSYRKKYTAPDWQRPSQLMCWLNAPRFNLTQDDYEMFGIESISRSTGGVYVGVNKAIGKHHWEVFVDEANYDPTVKIDNLTTTTMRGQLEAAGDFDIEWGQNPAGHEWQQRHLADFRTWLINNGFDPNDKSLTIGHPQVGQVDLQRTFGTDNHQAIWAQLSRHLNVWQIKTSTVENQYNYTWSDDNFIDLQVERIIKGN